MPRRVDTEALPDPQDTVGPYVVRALILDQMTSDRNILDHGIVLHYVVDGQPEQTTAMRHSGGQG